MVVCCKNNAHFSKEAKGVKSVAVRIWHKRMRLHMTHAELWQYLSCSKTIVLLYWDSCVTWYINLMSHMECTRSYISIYTQLPINIFPLEWLKNKAKIHIASFTTPWRCTPWHISASLQIFAMSKWQNYVSDVFLRHW